MNDAMPAGLLAPYEERKLASSESAKALGALYLVHLRGQRLAATALRYGHDSLHTHVWERASKESISM